MKRDVVTYNAVLDAVCSQVDLAEQIFHEGVGRGFYAKVSRLGTQWLELDLHFLSLGGGETALRWWFEKCLVPYLGNSKELASVKSIDIVTGYGKTRARGARKGDDSMRKRVRAMLSFMNVCEVVQPNLGRIHIDKQALMKEVERNCGRIIFDAHGYEQFKLQEGLDEPYFDAPQFVRPRGGALHDRAERDQCLVNSHKLAQDRPDCVRDGRSSQSYYSDEYQGKDDGRKLGTTDGYNASDRRGNHHQSVIYKSPACCDRGSRPSYLQDPSCTSAPYSFHLRQDRMHLVDQDSHPQSYQEVRHGLYGERTQRTPNSRFEPPMRHAHLPQSERDRDYNNCHNNLSWISPRPSYNDRKRPHDRYTVGSSSTQEEFEINSNDHTYGGRRDHGEHCHPTKRHHR